MKSHLLTARWIMRGTTAHILSLIVAGLFTLSAGILCAAPSTPLLTSLEVSSNMKLIIIGKTGQTNTPTSFVMKKPYRLVLDFAETGFTKIPKRMKFPGIPIREIRCGRYKSKARVVIDFGSKLVPAYRVYDRGNHVLVKLAGRGRKPSPKKKAIQGALRDMEDSPASVRNVTAIRDKSGPTLRVGSVDIEDGLIAVELCDKAHKNRCWRLVVEADVERMTVDRATISDVTGDLKAFELAPVTPTTRLVESRQPTRRDAKQFRGRGVQSARVTAKRKSNEPKVSTRGPRRLTAAGAGKSTRKLALGP